MQSNRNLKETKFALVILLVIFIIGGFCYWMGSQVELPVSKTDEMTQITMCEHYSDLCKNKAEIKVVPGAGLVRNAK